MPFNWHTDVTGRGEQVNEYPKILLHGKSHDLAIYKL